MSSTINIDVVPSHAPSDEKPESMYHSLTESGEAQGIGLTSGLNNDDDSGNPPTKMEVFEQEQYQERNTGSIFHSSDIHLRFTDAQYKNIINALYLSVGAIFGSLFRIIVAQIFGESCRNPDTIGWLAASSPLCVTADGEVGSVNGIVFADFPANMLGCFIMGFMVSTDVLGLPVSAPITWLPPEHFFQSYDALHLAIRTGFCGSLTTFSSWNSDMVVMMYATGVANTKSMVIRAMIGYIVGMETALGSFAFGRTIALWIHRWTNPILRQEEDAVFRRKAEGVYINNKLPEFERRFLPDLDMDSTEDIDPKQVAFLERWRVSTKEARRVGHVLLPTLIEIEECVLIQRKKATPALYADATQADWDLAALEVWVEVRDADNPVHIQPHMPDRYYSWKAALLIFSLCMAPLLVAVFFLNGEDDYSVTYRTMVFAALLASPGALLRWKLSKLNGKLPIASLSWLPIGTLAANVVGCMISISAIAIELRLDTHAWEYGIEYGFVTIGSLRAIKVGFAGSLTTVSTFASEVANFIKCSLTGYRAYIYTTITIGSSCVVSVLIYGLIVYVF